MFIYIRFFICDKTLFDSNLSAMMKYLMINIFFILSLLKINDEYLNNSYLIVYIKIDITNIFIQHQL